MFENYKLVFPGTNIHAITFSIIAFEFVILFYQIILYLVRPTDKGRLWYLILLILLIVYNIAGGLFPDPRLNIDIYTQYIIAYTTGILMSIYFSFYIYKFLDIKGLKYFAFYGTLWFLIIPFIITFIIPYTITRDIGLCSKLVVVVPFLYALSYLFYLIKNIKNGNEWNNKDSNYKEKIFGVSVALVFWICGLSLVTFFHGDQILEHSITNAGFLFMTVIFIRSTILESRKEYKKLLKSEQELHNINELLRIKVKERSQELEVSNEQRINSFINLAHEIQTPITLVKNYLEDFISNHKDLEDIKLLKVNIDKLSNDIVKFFNEERLIKGLSPQFNHNQIIDLSKQLKNRVLLFKPYANKKRIELSSNIDNDLFLKADPDAMDSLINNLIENAIKYTGIDGRIVVSLKAKEDNILFSVKDNGCGIPENMHKQIFEPYIQVLSGKQYSSGLGVGLFLVNKIVASLKGEIHLQSKKNEGSEFMVSLRRYYLSADDTLSNPSGPNKTSLLDKEEQVIEDAININSSFSVFLIEDNFEMLRYLRNKLKDIYNVYVATSGRDALEKLKHMPKPDLFISDVMMDEMDGFELLKIITDNPKYNHIPFIFLTAKTTAIDRMQGLTMGAIDYIYKPFSGNELLKKVESILRNAEKQKENILNTALEVISNNLKNPVVINDSKNLKLDQNCKIYNITNREKEIIIYVAEGLTYKEISEKLNISEKTLVKHRQNIFKKVNVKSKMDLINKLFES